MITTFAGNGVIGFSGDGGPATAAQLSNPIGVAVDGAGNVYIADQNNHVIRKVNSSGIISTYAGNAAHGYTGDGGPATAATLYYPIGVAVDASGNLFIADNQNDVIRKVNTAGIISTVAGNGLTGYSGDGASAISARLANPKNVALDPSGNLYITDYDNQVVRKVNTSGIISTFAGTGVAGYTGNGGPATMANLYRPFGVTTDPSGNVYFSEMSNNVVMEVNTSGVINVIAGNNTPGYSGDFGPATFAQLNQPMGIAIGCTGNLFIADNANYVIRVLGSINITPSFVNGAAQTISVCHDSSFSLNTTLAISDINVGQVETWSVVSAPLHGVLSASYSTTSTGSVITPAGLQYVPTAGYTGSDSFKVKISDGISFSTTTVYASVATAASAGTISGSLSICAGATSVLSTGVSGGTWSSSNPSVATVSASGVVTAVTAGGSTITYAVSSACSSAYATANITVNSLASAGTVDGAASVCQGSTMIYSDAISGGLWSSSNTSVATVSSTGVVTGVLAGLATITYTVSNSCGNAYSLRDATVSLMPIASTIHGSSIVCLGSTITLTDDTTYGSWFTTNASIATVNVATGAVTGLAAGVVTISYSVHNACGVSSVTKDITVGATTVSSGSIAGASHICVGSSSTFSDTTSGGSWSTGSSSVATVNAAGQVYGVSTGSVTLTYTVSTTCGSSVTTKTITVDPVAPAGTIGGSSSVCTGSNITLTETVPGGVWSSSNASRAAVSGTGVVTGVNAGAAVISYTVTNGCGSVSATYNETVNAHPVTGPISGASSVCSGASATLTDVTLGGTWISGAASLATINASGIVTGVNAGTAVISYQLTNSCGTAVSTSMMVVNPLPSAGSISGNSSVAAGYSVSLTDATSGGLWSSSNSLVASVNASGSVSGITTGSAIITYSVASICGSAYTTHSMNVVILTAAITGINVTTAGGHDGCALLTVSGGTMPYTFLWSNGAVTQNLTGISAGTYSVVVTDAMGNTTTASVVITAPAGRFANENNSGITPDSKSPVMNAFPNPFNTVTAITFTMPEDDFVTVEVFSATNGIKVATLFSENVTGGVENKAILSAGDLASGVYIYKIATGTNAYIGKVVLMK